MTLHEELDRIAARAPVAEVSLDTWQRGRRARRRDTVLIGAASVVVVALLVGAVGLFAGVLPDHPAPATGPHDGAVPDRISEVPSFYADTTSPGHYKNGRVSDNLAIGRGAVAFATSEGVPVVIGATDGAYHLLALPDYVAEPGRTIRPDSPIAISPDGTHLAYGWAGPIPAQAAGPEAVAVPSGIRVVDLMTGDVRTIALTGGKGTLIRALSWSPDGRWLAWQGYQASEWTTGTLGKQILVAGRIDAGSDASTPVPTTGLGVGATHAIAVADDGEVVLVSEDRILRWNGQPIGTSKFGSPMILPALAAFSTNGKTLAVTDGDGTDVTTLVWPRTAHQSEGLPQRTAFVHSPADGAEQASSTPVGWIDPKHVVTYVNAVGDVDGSLVVVDRLHSTYDVVASVHGDVLPDLSVATDLMTLDHPTVSRPAPDFPWSPDARRGVAIVASGGVLLLALAGMTFVLVRRRHRN